jgi:nucleoside 2-deoxyribosyltransferase
MTTSLVVVGGSYGEECSYPRRRMLRGSGMRAAAVVSSFGTSVSLRTCTGPTLGAEFQDLATRLGIHLEATTGAQDVWFRYRHPLGRPEIHPAGGPTAVSMPEVTTGDLLVFGMLEGRPVSHGERVVYDPQDGIRSRAYGSNGSTARQLVNVVSVSEGRALTGKSDPHEIAAALLAQPSSHAAVVKCGPSGAVVATADAAAWVHVFPSTAVYKIGSGDVFSAAFAQAWMRMDLDVVEAAWLASRLVAEYVTTGLDRFETERLADLRAQARRAMMKNSATGPMAAVSGCVYLAGPFFNTSQQWLVDEAREALRELGVQVFSPVHDVGMGPPSEVVGPDLEALERANVVLALLDGLDAGTVFEVGYARAKGIPVVGVAENVSTDDLTMLLGSDCVVTNDLASGIYQACWKLMGHD